MPVINQMAYSGQDTDSVSKSFSLHFWVRSKAVNRHATRSDLCLFTSFSQVCICLGIYEDFPSYGQFQGMNRWATVSFCILSLHEGVLFCLLHPLQIAPFQQPEASSNDTLPKAPPQTTTDPSLSQEAPVTGE